MVPAESDEPKLILTYPHKSGFNMIGWPSMVSSSLIVLSILKHLISNGSDFSDTMIIVAVLIYGPILIFFMGSYLFLNGVKLEIDENNTVKYYTYGSRGQSVLHFKFRFEDIEQVTVRKYPFDCSKVTVTIRNPICCVWHEKKLNKQVSVNIIADRKASGSFRRHMEQFQRDKISA